METVLKLENVTKTMGKRKVVDNVSFETYQGEVFGFLGPNGAGKTTTIKMITGLLFKDNGSVYINGYDVEKHFEEAMSQIGCIVENPEMYDYLTGMQNLQQFARMRTGITQQRINEVIELVGLKNRIKDKVKKYSLGMKQRLGVAQAILHRPRLLILDEPTNGLDPAGIKDLRDIFKRLAHEEGICVFISSHLLSEMELMCDRAGIIINGRLETVKSIEELIHYISGSGNVFHYKVSSVQQAVEEAEKLSIPVDVLENSILELKMDAEQMAAYNTALITRGVRIQAIVPYENTLEEAFIEITKSGGGVQIV